MTAPCPNREGTYVPWSWGEVFACSSCGQKVRQGHAVQPLRNPSGRQAYDSVYPIPAHSVKS